MAATIGITSAYIHMAAKGYCFIQSPAWSATNFAFKATISAALNHATIFTFKLMANFPIRLRLDVK